MLAHLKMSFQYDELASKGNFSREDIVTMLTAHEGSSDAAFQVSIVITVIIIIIIIVVIMIIIVVITVIIIIVIIIIVVNIIMQELNKAQLKPFLMRIWGQVADMFDMEDNIL